MSVLNTSQSVANIVVLGSLNMDLVLRTQRCAIAGETLSGHDFALHPGGKGANQAVACARMGAPVRMIGKLGRDPFADELRKALSDAGVNHDQVLSTTGSSGIAMIIVEDDGQNRIMLAPGANQALTVGEVLQVASSIQSAALLICQLEIPLPVVREAFTLARGARVPILFNPAPAIPLDRDLLAVDYLVLNETEAAMIADLPVSNRAEAEVAAHRLRQIGANTVLLTLGAEGVIVADLSGIRHYPALDTTVIDTTAAGDTFIGGLATGLLEGMHLDQAVHLGLQAAAICVSRAGAQPAIPLRAELGTPAQQ